MYVPPEEYPWLNVSHSVQITESKKNGKKFYIVEDNKGVFPFEVKRYYITSGDARDKVGGHCHFVEGEVFICVQGRMKLVTDKYGGRKMAQMVCSGEDVHVPKLVWHEIEFMENNTVFIALSSTLYDASRKDYCENYEDFCKLIEDKNDKA